MRIKRHITHEACKIRPGSEKVNVQILIITLIFQKRSVRLREVTERPHNQQAAQQGCESRTA